jgi:hypothetical protein
VRRVVARGVVRVEVSVFAVVSGGRHVQHVIRVIEGRLECGAVAPPAPGMRRDVRAVGRAIVDAGDGAGGRSGAGVV